MSLELYIIFTAIAFFRIAVLGISKINEEKLSKQNSKEYGAKITQMLAILHTLFYFASFGEGIINQQQIDILSKIGLGITLLSYLVLVHVIYTLGKYWTVKLIFANEHEIINQGLFRFVKHPNYFFNILPELVGVTLIFHSWVACVLLIFPYCYCLWKRLIYRK